MRVAHLILSHKNPAQVDRLIRALEQPGFDFYLHIDKKSDETAFHYIAERPNIYFIKKRAKIYWASFGTIQATLNGFEEILPGGYDYINVISGQDFPIKPSSYIYNFILENKGAEFITCESIEDEWKEAAERIRRYNLINWQIPGKHRLGKLINKILPERKFPFPDHKIVGRANWFMLSTDAIHYCLSFLKRHPELIRFYKYVWGADEFIFSTILYNSPFKDKIRDNLTYVDWSGQRNGHPRIIRQADFEKLKLSDKLFARKLDTSTDESIVSLLEEWISVKK